MSTRGEELAARFAALADEVIAEIGRLDSTDLAKTCEAEQCTVAALACHLANVYGGLADWIGMVVTDQPLPDITMTDIDAMNAAEAIRNAQVGQDEILSRLRANGDRMYSVLRELSDADTARPVSFSLLNGHRVTLGTFIDSALLGQFQEHVPSIRATVGR